MNKRIVFFMAGLLTSGFSYGADCSFLEGRYGLEGKPHATVTIQTQDTLTLKFRSPGSPFWNWDEIYIADGQSHEGSSTTGDSYQASCSDQVLTLHQNFKEHNFITTYSFDSSGKLIENGQHNGDSLGVRNIWTKK